jgi:hypothetical protein
VYYKYAGVGFFIALYTGKLSVFIKENLTVKNETPKLQKVAILGGHALPGQKTASMPFFDL